MSGDRADRWAVGVAVLVSGSESTSDAVGLGVVEVPVFVSAVGEGPFAVVWVSEEAAHEDAFVGVFELGCESGRCHASPSWGWRVVRRTIGIDCLRDALERGPDAVDRSSPLPFACIVHHSRCRSLCCPRRSLGRVRTRLILHHLPAAHARTRGRTALVLVQTRDRRHGDALGDGSRHLASNRARDESVLMVRSPAGTR